jgi:nicotinamide mononucleotide transporter
LLHSLDLNIAEVLGFVTGGWAVWLTVKENLWLWPVSIANNAFFLVLFGQQRLFADAALQVVYLVLEVVGWYWWLSGGVGRTRLTVRRTGWGEWAALIVLGVLSTVGMTILLGAIGDAAPLLDGVTTVLSLIAQWLLTRKLLENWWIWMVADLIYVGLYAYKHLLLTGVLYAVFFAMCVVGLRNWSRSSASAPYPTAMSRLARESLA